MFNNAEWREQNWKLNYSNPPNLLTLCQLPLNSSSVFLLIKINTLLIDTKNSSSIMNVLHFYAFVVNLVEGMLRVRLIKKKHRWETRNRTPSTRVSLLSHYPQPLGTPIKSWKSKTTSPYDRVFFATNCSGSPTPQCQFKTMWSPELRWLIDDS